MGQRLWAVRRWDITDASRTSLALLAFWVGGVGVLLLPELPSTEVLLALLVGAAFGAFLPGPLSNARWVLLATAVGFCLCALRSQQRLDQRWPLARHGETVELSGYIDSLPELQLDPAQKRTYRFTFRPVDKQYPLLRATAYRSEDVYVAGSCRRLLLRIRSPYGWHNPAGLDYEAWLFRQGIGGVATVKKASDCPIPASQGLLHWRGRLRDRLTNSLPDTPTRGVLIALLMGDDHAVQPSQWQTMRATGTTHLLAISGFNLAIVAGVIWGVVRVGWALSRRLCRFLPAPTAGLLAGVIGSGAYALLAGAEPPVLRAWLMLTVGAFVLLRFRAVSPWLAWLWCAVILSFIDPLAWLSAGTWLSFGAVGILIALFIGRLRAPSALTLWWAPQLALSATMAGGVLWHFGEFSALGPPVNLIAVPYFAVLTPIALVALGVWALAPAIGLQLLVAIQSALGWFMDSCAALAAAWPQLTWHPGVLGGQALLMTVAILCLLAPMALALRPFALALAALAALGAVRAPLPDGALRIQVLDVGQGLAVILHTRNHHMVFDAGPRLGEDFDAGARVLLPSLYQEGITQLDAVLISHSDLDHAGGSASLRAQIPTQRWLGDGGAPCRAGQHWEWDGVRFAVLHGPQDAQGMRRPDNNGSCVLQVSAGPHAALLAADIEAEAEARLLQSGALARNLRVLIAPHHGSKTSSTPAFVAHTNPDWVIFAAGHANRFGHPRPEVVDRYLKLGSQMQQTGLSGAVEVLLDPRTQHAVVRTTRQTQRRFWQWPAPDYWQAIAPVDSD